MSAVLFPDAVALIVSALDAVLDVPVRHRIPATRPASFVTVTRTGGVRRTIVSDDAQLTVECWAATDEAAMDLAQEVRRQLHDLPGRVLDGAAVYAVDEVGGPQDLPDDLSDHPRVIQTVLVHLRGASVATP